MVAPNAKDSHRTSDRAGLFNRAIALEPKSQKTFFYYAKYLDQLMQDAQKRQAARASAASKHMDRIGGKARSRPLLPMMISGHACILDLQCCL